MFEILGPWIAIQQVEAREIGSGLLKPWTAKSPETLICEVLAIGTGIEDPGFGVGDFILVEKMSGHPHMSGEAPQRRLPNGELRPGKTVPVFWPASEFGGDADKMIGLVRFGDLMPVLDQDEECQRRLARGADLATKEHDYKKSADDVARRSPAEEMREHAAWVKTYEASREGHRRTRLKRPVFDDAQGEGVLAVFQDAQALLDMGVNGAWLADRLGISPEEG